MRISSIATNDSEKVVGWLFCAFMVLVIVGLEPFPVQDWQRFQRVASGEGDTLRQLSYLTTFMILAVTFSLSKGLNYFRILPLSLVIALVWLIATCTWSLDPELSMRRVGLTLLTTLFVFMSIHLLNIKTALDILRLLFAGVLICNLISVGFLQSAVHNSGDFISTSETIGAWRGMHFEKNIAGMTAAMGALLFFHTARERRRFSDWLLFTGEIVFLIGTQSKTSMLLLSIVLAFTAIYKYALRVGSLRQFILLFTIMLIPAVFIIVFSMYDQIKFALSDPDILTNRGYIWQVVLSALPDRLLAGYGFRAFWIGAASPVSSFAGASWVLTISHSHNGYLEVLIGTGLVGLILCVCATVVVPARNILSFRVAYADLWFSWVAFFLLLNATETELFERDRPAWILFLIAIAALHEGYHKRGPETNSPGSPPVFSAALR